MQQTSMQRWFSNPGQYRLSQRLFEHLWLASKDTSHRQHPLKPVVDLHRVYGMHHGSELSVTDLQV